MIMTEGRLGDFGAANGDVVQGQRRFSRASEEVRFPQACLCPRPRQDTVYSHQFWQSVLLQDSRRYVESDKALWGAWPCSGVTEATGPAAQCRREASGDVQGQMRLAVCACDISTDSAGVQAKPGVQRCPCGRRGNAFAAGQGA